MMSEVEPRRWWILLSIGIFAFMSNLDSSIVNIAMPIMAKQLDIPMNQIEWVVSIYLIIVSALLLFFGKLGDMYGKIKVFRIGTAIFIIGSFLSGLQWTFSFLLLGRIIQGIGSAMTLSNTYGITTATFSLKERGRAMGLIGTFVAFGAVAGPGIGGLVLSRLSWGYIFWINVPLGIFKIKAFSYGVGAAILIFLSNFFTVVLMPFYLEDARQLSAGQAGLLLVIFPIVMMVIGPVGGVLADRFNPAKIVTLGLSTVALSQLGYWFLDLRSPLWVYVVITVIMAVGTGLFQSPNSDIVMSVVGKDQLGSAGSINALARNVGMVSGTALSTSVLFTVMSLIADTKVTTYLPSRPELFISGMHVAFTGSFLLILGAIWLSAKQGSVNLK